MDDEPLDLPAFLPYRLVVAANRVGDELARLYADRFGLTIPEWRVMAVIARFPGLSANEVAERGAMDKVQVSRAVARLMAAGRLERRLSPDDRRRSTLRLTDAGEETYGRIVPLARDYERRLMDRLPREDRTKLMGMLETISLPGEDRG